MRRTALTIVATITGLVLLLSFKTHGAGIAVSKPATISTGKTGTGTTSTGSSSSSGSTSSGSTSSGSSASGSSATSTGSSTVTGDSVDTRWGPVQVQITVANGKVTAAQAVVYPQNNGRDQEINSYAVPALNQEAVAAGSANIQMVSGATYTSDGYIQSLQSALDKAGVA